jgi:TorA maturation chaperone TorD
MGCYQALALAFSYPGPSLFRLWPQWAVDEPGMAAEYDRLFRTGEVWLYGAEYAAENEFQRARMLSDVMGFYHAFGAEPDKERPDALACELEFMQCLILKHARIDSGAVCDPAGDKAEVCRQAQRKFFAEYLAPAAVQIGSQLRVKASHPFYRQAAEDLQAFVESECGRLGVSPPQPREKTQQESSDQQDFCGGHCI